MSEQMGRLISVHKTATTLAATLFFALTFGLAFMLAMIEVSEVLSCLIGPLLIAVIYLQGSHPRFMHRLEIYEDGMVHAAFLQTRRLSWIDVKSVEFGYHKSTKPNILRLEAYSGTVIRLQSLKNWDQMCGNIVDAVEPFIKEEAIERLQRGAAVRVTGWLQIDRNGLVLRGRLVDWLDIDYVWLDKRKVVIGSRIFDNFTGRVTFDRYRTRNGVVYANLIRHLWQDRHSRSKIADSTYIVVAGVHFNSEGEMISIQKGNTHGQAT